MRNLQRVPYHGRRPSFELALARIDDLPNYIYVSEALDDRDFSVKLVQCRITCG